MNDKQKVTVYLTPDAKQKLDELFVKHLMNKEKKTYSEIISEAIGILYSSNKEEGKGAL